MGLPDNGGMNSNSLDITNNPNKKYGYPQLTADDSGVSSGLTLQPYTSCL